jgi:amino-acid N-acetyltransferase
MKSSSIEAAGPGDTEDLLRLVAEGGLPFDGLREHLGAAIVARDDAGQIVGGAALELYDDGVLLRSVVVAPRWRGHRLGHALVEAAIQMARDRGAPAIYLLTTTAEGFFPRFGFEPIARTAVPPGVQGSVEFTTACPSSATVMRKVMSA